MGDELPVDTIYNILSRMPLKSLARFQCVSKLWRNYINDPYLEMMRAKLALKDPSMLIMFQLFERLKSSHPSASLISMLVTNKEEEEFAAAGTSSVHDDEVVITEKPPHMEFWCKGWSPRFIVENIVLGYCKGLILSSQDDHRLHVDGTTVLVVINPLRKEERYKLPPIKIWSRSSVFRQREACGLGFDDSTGTYKMVCVVLRNREIMLSDNYNDDVADVVKEDLCTMVHVLGTDSSWREIPAVPPYPISGEAVFANGCLHWLVSFLLKYWLSGVVRKVVCFDMVKEEFGLIDPPPNTLTNWGEEHLVDLDGQVGLVYDDVTRKCCVEVWLLKKTKWVIHCRFDKKPPLPLNQLIKVIGYWNKDAGYLLITDAFRKRLFIYCLKEGVLHEANFINQNQKINAFKIDIRVYQSTFSSILRSSVPSTRPMIDDGFYTK